MPSKKPSIVDALRAKHDPHYQLSGKVGDLEKDLPIQLSKLHKTLSKSFAMQRKTLKRVIALEKKVGQQGGTGATSTSSAVGSAVAEQEQESKTGNGINGKSLLGADDYEKYVDELQQEGTIGGSVVTGAERKEGFKKRGDKVNFEKFVNKVLSKKGGGGEAKTSAAIPGQKLLPGTADAISKGEEDGDNDKDGSKDKDEDKDEIEEGENKDKLDEVLDFIRNFLDPSLTRIEQSLDGILGNLSDEIEADKDKADDLKGDIADAKMDSREDKLEGKKKGLMGSALDKAIKPVESFFGQLLKFFVNVILGTVVMRILKIIEKPKRLLDPLFMTINGITWVLNSIMEAFHFLSTTVLKGVFLALTLGPNLLIKGINKALELLPMVDFQIPELKMPELPGPPQIPKIPLADDPGQAPPVAMAGGGLVPGYAEGGEVGDQQGQIDPLTLLSLNTGLPGDQGAQGVQGNQGAQGAQGDGPAFGPAMFPGGLGGGGGGLGALTEQAKVRSKEDQGFFGKVRGGLDMLTGNIWDLDRQDVTANTKADANRTGLENYASDSGGGENISGTGLQRMSGGGLAQHFNRGGHVPGKGEGDTVPAMLTPGEFVMSKGAVQQIGVDNLMAMNKRGGGTNKPEVMKFAGGGQVTSAPNPPSSGGGGFTVLPAKATAGAGAGGGMGGGKSEEPPNVPSQDSGNAELIVIKSIYSIGT